MALPSFQTKTKPCSECESVSFFEMPCQPSHSPRSPIPFGVVHQLLALTVKQNQPCPFSVSP